MELFDNTDTTQQPAAQHGKKCKHCSKPIEGGTSRKEYCNEQCRSLFNKHKPKVSMDPDDQPKKDNKPAAKPDSIVAHLDGLGPQAKFIVHQQEKEIAKLEEQLKEERKKREDAEDEVSDLEAQLLQRETSLKGLQDAQPPMWLQILQQLPPAVVEKATEKLMGLFEGKSAAPLPQMEGLENLDEDSKVKLQNIAGWFATLPKDQQNSVFLLFNGLKDIPNPQALTVKLTHLNATMKANNNGYSQQAQGRMYGYN